MPEVLSFLMPTKVIFGEGALDQLAGEVAPIARRCAIVTGRRAIRLAGLLERVQESLLAACIESVLFDQVEPNPTVETIQDGAAFVRDKEARWILGVGGGSALDAAKAIALLASNGTDLRPFLAGARPENPPLVVVAIPTTAGTGSEVTPYAVLTDVAAGDKAALSLPQLFPRLALLDPVATRTMPEAVTVDTGLDALSHAVEALFSARRTLFSDFFARAALERIQHSLPVVKARADDLDARAEMQLAACLAGMAIAQTATLVPHALSYPVTVHYDLPHGRAVALLLPAFLEVVREQEPARVAEVGRLLGAEDDPGEALRSFIESLGVAPRLGAYGIKESDLERFSQLALPKRHLALSPGEWLAERLIELYRRSL